MIRSSASVWSVLGGILLLAGPALGASPTDVFNQRIMPIFTSAKPSSCIQCHLASVDLKQYILPSSDATFAALRDQGLIDLDAPKKSKILTLIRMGLKDPDDTAKLIHQDTREAELEAFSAWIVACSQDARLRSLPAAKQVAGPAVADDVIRHARKSRILDSFARNVWQQRKRCFPCHTPHEIDPENPKHAHAVKTRKKMAEDYGAEALDRLSIFRESPEATFKYWIAWSKNPPAGRPPLIDLAQPTQSYVLQKPMSKLPAKKPEGGLESPSYTPPYTHMGGLKLHKDDQGYKSLVAWIQDYAKVVDGKYQDVQDLPEDNWVPTQFVLRIDEAPQSWPTLAPVQFSIHPWDEAQAEFRQEPLAFSQGLVNPRRRVFSQLVLLAGAQERAKSDSAAEPQLPRGRYLVKAYVDKQQKIEHDPTVLLGSEEFVGQAELKNARWRIGPRGAQVVFGKDLVMPK